MFAECDTAGFDELPLKRCVPQYDWQLHVDVVCPVSVLNWNKQNTCDDRCHGHEATAVSDVNKAITLKWPTPRPVHCKVKVTKFAPKDKAKDYRRYLTSLPVVTWAQKQVYKTGKKRYDITDLWDWIEHGLTSVR